MSTNSSSIRSCFLPGVVSLALMGACAATSGSQFAGGDSGGAGQTGGGGGDFTLDLGTGGEGSEGGDDASCAASSFKAETLPLDIYIMLDQSSSMTEDVAGGATKWDAVTGALKAFVGQGGLGGVSVGIQYFGLKPAGAPQCASTCLTDADCGGPTCGPCFAPLMGLPGVCLGAAAAGSDSCSAADYAKPDVEIAPLPGAAGAVVASIDKHKPTTSTPTAPALQGAIDHAKAWAAQHPGHAVIDVLATDGEPTECTPTDIGGIEAIAKAGADAHVPTFVIGVGSSLANLDKIAAAGGTGHAFLVDTTQNVNQQFLDALNQIRGAALGCSYQIPKAQAGTPDYGKVNVQYTPGGGKPEILPNVADAAHCPSGGAGWYYDDPAHPTQIILCGASCQKIGGDTTGAVDVLLGCKTVIK